VIELKDVWVANWNAIDENNNLRRIYLAGKDYQADPSEEKLKALLTWAYGLGLFEGFLESKNDELDRERDQWIARELAESATLNLIPKRLTKRRVRPLKGLKAAKTS